VSRGRILKALFVVAGVLGAAAVLIVPVHTQGPGNDQGLHLGLYKGRQVVSGEVLVKLVEQARLAPFGQDLDVDRDEQIGDGSIRRIHSRSHNVDTLLAKLSELDEVEYAEPNYVVYALQTPNDYYFPLLWGLSNTGQTVNGVVGIPDADINATQAWDVTQGSKANVVGVVDTGVDYGHADLAGNVWSAPADFQVTIGSTAIFCMAGTHGFNAITKVCNPMDDNGHGTHVSGTIGARANNGGVVGINWTASMMGLKFLNSQGSGTTADAVSAIEFAIQAKQIFGTTANVRVLSNSWGGGGFSQSLLNEINKANTNDMVFVAAAGNAATNNDSTPSYPSNYDAPNVVAVAATDNRDALASFSNYGATTVDLGAPGVYIASTYPGNGYIYMSGTSMATPHVSGAAALVLSACTTYNTADLKAKLLGSVDAVSSLLNKTVTGGRLNLYKAVTNCTIVPPPPPPQTQGDFSVSASPSSATVKRGRFTTYAVTVTPIGSFNDLVTFSVSGLPANATASFSPSSTTGGGSSGMTVTTKNTTPSGTYTLTIMGTDKTSNVARTDTVSLRIK
jgi:subtilisin family serine protease